MKFKLLVLFCGSLCTAAMAQSDTTAQADSSLTTAVRKINFFPVAYYTPETAFGFGIKVVHLRRPKGSLSSDRPISYSPTLIYTTQKQILTAFTADVWRQNNRQHIYGLLEYNDYPYFFFGVGNDTRPENEEAYTSRTVNLTGQFEQRITSKVYLGARYDLKRETIPVRKENGVLAKNEIIGSNGFVASGLGPSVIYDTRDNLFTPKTGAYHQAYAQYFGKFLGSDTNFMRYRLDLRKYFSGVGPGVIALQSMFMFTTGDVPFQFMSPLGGVNVMRGLLEGRFRDDNAMVYQAEYRFPLFWKISGAAFAGTGQVAKYSEDFSLSRFHFTGGGGLRYKLNNEGMVVRGDIATSKEGVYIYFAFSEAF
ncbi:BamA/TamA family outer membrane protein [Rufibacter sp. LB8]|uniref:BamA/TamA family outer membrane protein n=2 Tax=Rufibacter sp. LB8 TaxID=2777781 RepID=UPI00178C7B79|nr:BamA/TamA family outer membrane protein [Rufibacter sp. LB8]